MRKNFLSIAVTLGVLFSAAGQARAKEPLNFIFITTCQGEAFFEPVKKGMRDAAAALKVQCEFTGTEGVDLKAQAEMVRKAVAAGCDGIALNIIDADAFDEVVAEALAKGVPVVAFNVDAQGAQAKARKKDGTADSKAAGAERLSAVCQDFVKAGRTLGEKAVAFIPRGSKVLITLHDEGISALDERQQGIQEVLKREGIAAKVICSSNEPLKAAERIAAELKAEPEIRCVLGTGQTDTEAAGKVIERDYAGKGYQSAGFDLSGEILRLIEAGVIQCTIDQQPYSQGYYPVVQLTLYCRYGIRPSDIDAGAGVVEKKDVRRIIGLTREHYR
ncbi:MAG: substrate-binding domain-containing protein [Pirellulales bacterium]|nr:substrate-binding domain-containing protein [Pirellulales bacterium]